MNKEKDLGTYLYMCYFKYMILPFIITFSIMIAGMIYDPYHLCVTSKKIMFYDFIYGMPLFVNLCVWILIGIGYGAKVMWDDRNVEARFGEE